MMISVLAAMAMGQTASAPRIQVTITGGKSFVILTDPQDSPKTVQRIVALVNQGFYNDQRFHRVEGWVVQWGDPKSKQGIDDPRVGSGGSGQGIPFESSTSKFGAGTVGIASTGAKVGGDSQLFVITQDAPHLAGNYAVLGKVVSGMDVVRNIKRGDKIVSMTVVKPK